MTPATQETCLNLIAGMLSPSQAWGKPTASLYVLVMQDWADDIAIEAVKHAALTESFRPSPATLRQIAAKLAAEAAGPLPSLSSVRQEVRKLIIYHGPRAASANHSHPLIAAIVDELGDWQTIGRMESDHVDNAFPAAYERAVKHLHEEIAQTMLSLPAAERQGRLMLCARRREVPTARVSIGAEVKPGFSIAPEVGRRIDAEFATRRNGTAETAQPTAPASTAEGAGKR